MLPVSFKIRSKVQLLYCLPMPPLTLATRLEGDLGERVFEQLRRLTEISCWHRSSYESDALWQLYAGACTSLGRLSASAATFRLEAQHKGEEFWGGNVKYVGLLHERLRINAIGKFWHKHMAFSSKREFRLRISLSFAEEFGVTVPEQRIRAPFDFDMLVDRIFLDPSLEPQDVQLTRKSAEMASLGDRVRVSSLLGTPRYT
ncbi:hypothetical protein Noc_2069 [Nitrosococcus oceani ATCC 19707]|uniref:DUF2971 domain-containing protein n=1 Tax=Nitrosococcus oceani (strain ATCC 19707 / BCRC 17464 / JCM 30415 / NCIMB 11848 / C-107) TaxID=323261 RepID=Q3J9G7_NITOC|nr:hypothetical protein Noc_2069 [Nitrosococcus oceani ATCC 19707]